MCYLVVPSQALVMVDGVMEQRQYFNNNGAWKPAYGLIQARLFILSCIDHNQSRDIFYKKLIRHVQNCPLRLMYVALGYGLPSAMY